MNSQKQKKIMGNIVTKRFFVVSKDLVEVAIKLEAKGYLQLPDAGKNPTKAIIDKERKQFWFLEQPGFENNCSIINNHYKQDIHVLENDDLKDL